MKKMYCNGIPGTINPEILLIPIFKSFILLQDLNYDSPCDTETIWTKLNSKEMIELTQTYFILMELTTRRLL